MMKRLISNQTASTRQPGSVPHQRTPRADGSPADWTRGWSVSQRGREKARGRGAFITPRSSSCLLLYFGLKKKNPLLFQWPLGLLFYGFSLLLPCPALASSLGVTFFFFLLLLLLSFLALVDSMVSVTGTPVAMVCSEGSQMSVSNERQSRFFLFVFFC